MLTAGSSGVGSTAKNYGCDVRVSLAEALLHGAASIFCKFMVKDCTAYKPAFWLGNGTSFV